MHKMAFSVEYSITKIVDSYSPALNRLTDCINRLELSVG